MDRCPICQVAIKPENLIRHLSDTHPHHPETPALLEKLKEEPGRVARPSTAAPFRLKRWHVVLVVLVVLGGVGAYYLSPYLTPRSGPFPCVTPPFAYHWHSQLTIFSAGVRVTIPANVGVRPGCLQPVHTHDATGQLHMEPAVFQLFTIGDFFLVWEKSFGNPTQMIVNGTSLTPNTGVRLWNGQTIDLHYAFFA